MRRIQRTLASPHANADWNTKSGQTSWYITTCKAKTASMWAKQYLCISMINALGKPLHQGIAKALLKKMSPN